MLTLKLSLLDKMPLEEQEIVDYVNDGLIHRAKLTANKLDVEQDYRNPLLYKTIKNVKLVFSINGREDSLVLKGNLCSSFRPPKGGEFFVKKAMIIKGLKFDTLEGVVQEIEFSNYPMTIDSFQRELMNISNDNNFVFNMSQFEEFMEIFNFYKQLSAELNNNDSFEIVDQSKPYYFVYSDEKEIKVDDNNAVYNSNGMILGYRLDDDKYEFLNEDQKVRVRTLIDVKINGDLSRMKKVRSFHDSLYVSKISQVTDENVRELVSFDPVNVVLDDNQIVISGEEATKGNYQYLNLYDMGQKIKLESINNSLKLIEQGGTGQAAILLEYLIGDKVMPSNGKKPDKTTEKYTEALDESQKKAFLMAIDGSPVSLIKGPPGTGKTHVINAVVQYITKELGEKVVISSQTHVAIDNVLDKLMENYDLIIPNRITNRRNKYAGEYIDTTLFKTWGKEFSQHNLRAINKDLAGRIAEDMSHFKGERKFFFSERTAPSDYSVIGATTTTSAIGGARGLEVLKGYDWLIIDEVSKCPITEVLRYLPYVKHIIMVGDDFQLAPLLEFQKDEVKNLPSYDEEKFDRLHVIYENSVFATTLDKARKAGRLVTLNVNYRSVSQVLGAYNVFYDNELKNMRESVKPTKVQLKDGGKLGNDKDVFFVDVKNGKETRDSGATSRYNIEEIEATAEILRILMEEVIDPINVSVSAIFPYAAQIEKFQKKNIDLINAAKKHFKSFEIDTVDAFQGRETDIVLVNTVVTDSSQRNFLNDFRRINVSMSRARDKLFVFGNPHTLSKIEMQVTGGAKRTFFNDIIMDIRRYGRLIEYDRGVRYEDSNKPKIKID